MSNELNTTVALSTDIHVITAEINAYKRIAGEAIFEIGRRLKLVRDAQSTSEDEVERALAQQRESVGGWIRWLEEHVDFKRTHAHKFITVYERLGGGDVSAPKHAGLEVLYEFATLPTEERTREHTLKSGETKRPDEMTQRQIREIKAALKAEREAREKAEAERERARQAEATLRDTIESIREQPPRVEYVENPELADRLQRYEERFGDIGTYESTTFRIPNSTDISASIQAFDYEVRSLLKKYAYLTQYKRELTVIPDAVTEDYEGTLEALRGFVATLQNDLGSARRGVKIINVN